ncbi:MAG: permease, partial [Chloroflexota bacterium]
MQNLENKQTEIMRRPSAYQPPRSLSHWLLGHPIQTADAAHQTIGKAVGLAVFASDALSSTAYATQEILGVLIVAGAMGAGYVFPVSMA